MTYNDINKMLQQEFLTKYEVIEQHGEIYTVREKD